MCSSRSPPPLIASISSALPSDWHAGSTLSPMVQVLYRGTPDGLKPPLSVPNIPNTCSVLRIVIYSIPQPQNALFFRVSPWFSHCLELCTVGIFILTYLLSRFRFFFCPFASPSGHQSPALATRKLGGISLAATIFTFPPPVSSCLV